MRIDLCRRASWLVSACLLTVSHHGLAQPGSPFEAPPQHRAARSDPFNATPMTVVPSTDRFLGQGGHWVPIDGAKCRHNTDTGIAVRLRPAASKVVVTLQGGGGCLTLATCLLSAAEYGVKEFQAVTSPGSPGRTKLHEGIWMLSSTSRADQGAPIPNADVPNRLADEYTEVFVPYCSGDMHVGARRDVAIPFVGRRQNFQGMANTELYYRYIFDQLLPRHAALPKSVILTGFSAGGYGAMLTASRLRELLPAEVGMSLILDSAPPFQQATTLPIPASRVSWSRTIGSPHDTLLRPCLQQRLHDTWGLADSVLRRCGPACQAGNWMNPMFDKVLKEQPDVPVALTSSTWDATNRHFMWVPMDANCAWEPNEAQYKEGLFKLRAQMQSARFGRGNTATFFISGDKTAHVAITSQRYFSVSQTTDGARPVRLQDWMQDLVQPAEGGLAYPVPAHVGP